MKTRMFVAVWLLGAAVCAIASYVSLVRPVTYQLTWYRSESAQAATADNGETAVYGTQILFTNCVLYDATTNAQGGTNLTVVFRIGNATEGHYIYTATYSPANTSWWAYATIPAAVTGTCYVQAQITDENTNTFVYPRKTISAADLFILEL